MASNKVAKHQAQTKRNVLYQAQTEEVFYIMYTVKLQNAMHQVVVATGNLCGFKKQVDMARKIQTIPDQMEAG